MKSESSPLAFKRPGYKQQFLKDNAQQQLSAGMDPVNKKELVCYCFVGSKTS